METKFNFNSAICTSRSQSEHLLALGLKKETADMFWWDNGYGSCAVISRPAEKEDGEYGKVIQAWSLHRLIEMMPLVEISDAICRVSIIPNITLVWINEIYIKVLWTQSIYTITSLTASNG